MEADAGTVTLRLLADLAQNPCGYGDPGSDNCYAGNTDGGGTEDSGGTTDTSSTGATSSTGGTSSEGRAWTSWLKGATDSVLNYGNDLAHDSNFWEGMGLFLSGGTAGGGGLTLIASGVVECGTLVLCIAGGPQIAVGAGALVGGYAAASEGAGLLGKAFSEASTEGDAGSSSSKSGEFVNEAELATDDEIFAAESVANKGHRVVLRDPPLDGGTRGVNTSDVLIDEAQGDIYSPSTGNMDRISGYISGKRGQVDGGYVILNLRNSPLGVGDVDVSKILHRVNSRPGKSRSLSGIYVIE